MTKYIDPEIGCWIVQCDWSHPEDGSNCTLGEEGTPRKFIDPDNGRNPEMHFQCGQHHGIVKQEDKPEFKLPDGHKLNEDILRSPTRDSSNKEV